MPRLLFRMDRFYLIKSYTQKDNKNQLEIHMECGS